MYHPVELLKRRTDITARRRQPTIARDRIVQDNALPLPEYPQWAMHLALPYNYRAASEANHRHATQGEFFLSGNQSFSSDARPVSIGRASFLAHSPLRTCALRDPARADTGQIRAAQSAKAGTKAKGGDSGPMRVATPAPHHQAG